jgi:hypothetical protein
MADFAEIAGGASIHLPVPHRMAVFGRAWASCGRLRGLIATNWKIWVVGATQIFQFVATVVAIRGPRLRPRRDRRAGRRRKDGLCRRARHDAPHRDGADPEALYRYVEVHRIYSEACDPRGRADVLVDNGDVDAPVIRWGGR